MKKILKHYPFTTLFIIGIFVICMIPIPDTPLSEVAYIDKWTHVALYFALCLVFWLEHFRCRSNLRGFRLFLVSFIIPILMGGLIEIMQATLTTCRSGEVADFVADTIGVVIGTLAGTIVLRRLFAKVRGE